MIVSLISLVSIAAASTAVSPKIGEFCSLAGISNASYKNKLCIVIGEPARDSENVLRVPVSCIKGDYYDANSTLSIASIRVPVTAVAEPDWDDSTQVRVVDLGFTVNGAPMNFPKDAMINRHDLVNIARLTEAIEYPTGDETEVASALLDSPLRQEMRLVGGIINQLYGFGGMQKGLDFQARKRGRFMGQLISRTWNYVGEWMD
jgi:hypothetical protein